MNSLVRIAFTLLLFIATLLQGAKPNLVYIMLDDAGYGDFSCYGQEKFKTPNIDRMASQGMRLTNFTPAARSAPPRAAAS